MNLPHASRRYVVSLTHSCGHHSPTSGEVSAHSLTDLLHLLHQTDNTDLACAHCGPEGMSVQSVRVILDEDTLSERLGDYADQLLSPVS